MTSDLRIRPAGPGDREFILALVPRLRAFGPPALRPPSALDEAEQSTLERALEALAPDATLLVAELPDLGCCGFAYAESLTDYFTRERHGHLNILAVAEIAEGRGVGQALLTAVETWSRAQGHRFLTLNVFAENRRARALYERAGYGQDIVRYVKVLDDSDSPTA
jgi:GNAT superfamily N-acetyltransferase